MDPISHALFAKTLHSFDTTNRLGRGAVVAFAIGGLSPDIDIVLAPLGWDIYLVHHEQGTHSLLGSPVVAVLLALLLRALVRGSNFRGLFLASWVGGLSHIFLDFVGGSDMRLFAPFSDLRAGWHLVAMGEPIVVIALLALHLPGVVRRRRTWAVVFLASFGCLLTAKYISQRTARTIYEQDAATRLVRVEEIRSSLFNWRLYERDGNVVQVVEVNALSGAIRPLFEKQLSHDGELVNASRQQPVVKNLFRVGEMPLVEVEHDGDERVVRWSDAQFCGPDRCHLFFGVVFDELGEPLRQFVDVVGFHRARPPSR